MMDKFKELKSIFPTIKKNVSLNDYCTFRIGGIADYFLEVDSSCELEKVILFCNENNINFYIIGAGSNLLISDKGFRGLIIIYRRKFGDRKISEDDFKPIGENMFKIKLDASFLLADAINQFLNFGFSGIEWAAGIPGTLGGAINGNAGAFGSSISDNINEVDVLKIEKGKADKIVMKKNDCNFVYRSSIFKVSSDYIILSGIFILIKKDKKLIRGEIDNILKKRVGKYPSGFSAGSIFKNYEGEIDKKLFKKYPELQIYNEKGIVPAGYLIEKCNLKGTKIGDAQISPNHANFIINLGKAKSDSVLKLIALIKKTVKEKFGISIQEEIKYLG
ncbi:MAG: UDP-N-acetylmuramate dehydrogenase [Candidatus Pacebacteria bacterium]|nr:UDP-N-acetylmuramate dehydrogenase [Candidatus Paceibacterota bacterium]